MHALSAYSAEERAAILDWLKQGLSASRIASAFQEKFGRYVSRNAIIGVIHRDRVLAETGLTPKPRGDRAGTAKDGRRTSPARIVEKTENRKAAAAFVPPKPARVDQTSPYAYDAASRRVPLAALGKFECRFAVNDAAIGELHLFCGRPAAVDSPYCAHHGRRASSGLVYHATRDNVRRQRVAA